MFSARLAIAVLTVVVAPVAAAQNACEDVPQISIGETLSHIVSTGELGGRPYRLVSLIPENHHPRYQDETIIGQIPAAQDANGDNVQLTAGEAMHLVVKPLGDEGGSKGGGDGLLYVLGAIAALSLAGWFATWKKLSAANQKLQGSGDDD